MKLSLSVQKLLRRTHKHEGNTEIHKCTLLQNIWQKKNSKAANKENLNSIAATHNVK
jgi:hypothetical protein